jgi:ketosteroid isomerase-like protein
VEQWDDRAEDLAQLRHMAAEFEAGFNTGDVDRIMRFYGDTYVDVNLRHPVQSWAERRAYYAQVIQGGFRARVRPDDVQIHGDFAFVRGTVELVGTQGNGGSANIELRYLEIAERQPDGSWKVMWGMDGPVQEYTPAT